jgi:hypothetical protein
MTPVKAGSLIYEPPNGHHYDMAKDEEVVVEIIGMSLDTRCLLPHNLRDNNAGMTAWPMTPQVIPPPSTASSR